MSAADEPRRSPPPKRRSLFADLVPIIPALILAVSGGRIRPRCWCCGALARRRCKRGPKLVAVTVDHGLRPEASARGAAVKRLARSLGVAHRTLRWTGRKPTTGLQEAAREARYRLLAEAARKAGARHILTAHTLDDQAETVLFRWRAAAASAGLPAWRACRAAAGRRGQRRSCWSVRCSTFPKARLIATLQGRARSPSPTIRRTATRASPAAAARADAGARARGADARTGWRCWRARARRADAALDAASKPPRPRLAPGRGRTQGRSRSTPRRFRELPEEIALRLLARVDRPDRRRRAGRARQARSAVRRLADALDDGRRHGMRRFRRTLAGALVTLDGGRITDRARAAARGAAPRNGLNQTQSGGRKLAWPRLWTG